MGARASRLSIAAPMRLTVVQVSTITSLDDSFFCQPYRTTMRAAAWQSTTKGWVRG
jgi:hypothetical protein